MRTLLNFNYKLKSIVSTLSTLISSVVWLEREVSEFSYILFIGLLDSRRLLKDYAQSSTLIGTEPELL